MDWGPDQQERYFLLRAIVILWLRGIAWAEVSNLHCATSRQAVTDTHGMAYPGNPRLSGKEDEKNAETGLVTAIFPSASALRLTMYSKSLQASLCPVSKLDHFIKSLESAPDLPGAP